MAIGFVMPTFAQRASVSTDAAKWLTASPNIAVSAAVTTRISVEVETSFNPLGEIFEGYNATHAGVQAGMQYWFKRPYYSHAIGLNVAGALYDLRVQQREARGKMAAVGVTYAYGFILNTRWAITPSVGFGYGARKEEGVVTWSPTFTKLGVGFSYIID